MGKLKIYLLAAAAVLLGACSGSDNTIVGQPATPGGPAVDIATLTLLTSSPQMPSDGAADATISALVRDANNNVVQDVSVIFTSSSGSLVVTQPATTDASGVLTATLSTAGDPTNRTIDVSAVAAGSVNASVSVNVVGTSITINGPGSIPLGSDGTYTIVVNDAAGDGIGGVQVDVTSDSGNGISANPLTTDASGEATFTLTANSGGVDTLTVTALGAEASLEVDVSDDTFTFLAPPAVTPPAVHEIDLGVNEVVEVEWLSGGGAVQNQAVDFSISRGTVSSAQELTDASGQAAITISSTNAGPATITASNANGTRIERKVEFVAITPQAMELQASPFTVAINEQSTITAIVRDPAGNLVKNAEVSFVLSDVTGGSLSVAQATTNSQGRAQTVYTASGTTSSVDGVRIDASVVGLPAVTDFVNLTVAQRELFISIGTGNSIEEPNTAQYRKEWVVQVTDAQGVGVADANVTFSVLSERYFDGFRELNMAGDGWTTNYAGNLLGCLDEDILTGVPEYDRNGVVDPGEDNNGSGQLEAGNIASAAAQGGSGSSLTTDQNGFGLIDLYWPQEYAYYLVVTLEARTGVQGTEFAEGSTFMLDGLADDFDDPAVAPPGLISAFGSDGDCTTAKADE